MQSVIKQSLRWNHLNRIFYKGLYTSLQDARYLQMYYQELEAAITLRGRWCRHYLKK
jgi:hypothetical protein